MSVVQNQAIGTGRAPTRRYNKRHTLFRLAFQVTAVLAAMPLGGRYLHPAPLLQLSRTAGVETMAFLRHFDAGR